MLHGEGKEARDLNAATVNDLAGHAQDVKDTEVGNCHLTAHTNGRKGMAR